MVGFVLEKNWLHHRTIAVYPQDALEEFSHVVAALSVHQLAAQGEMLYLATRIEQGNCLVLSIIF